LSSLASQEERADHICHAATLQGDSGYVNTYLDRLAEVTAAQVQQTAATWLTPKARAVVAYLKQDGDSQ
jgi:predicted Zn-dependent peptidase